MKFVPIDRLLDKAYAERIRTAIDPKKAGVSKNIKPGVERREGNNTNHYSIVDRWGNAVSLTYTLTTGWAKVTAADTGVLLNSEMDDSLPGLADYHSCGGLRHERAGRCRRAALSPSVAAGLDQC